MVRRLSGSTIYITIPIPTFAAGKVNVADRVPFTLLITGFIENASLLEKNILVMSKKYSYYCAQLSNLGKWRFRIRQVFGVV
jgi:hypothetical protein